MDEKPAVSRRNFVGGVATAVGIFGLKPSIDLFAQGTGAQGAGQAGTHGHRGLHRHGHRGGSRFYRSGDPACNCDSGRRACDNYDGTHTGGRVSCRSDPFDPTATGDGDSSRH